MKNIIKRDFDYWYDIVWGGILTFLIIYFIGILIFAKLGFDFLNIYYFLLCLIIVIFYQWKDDNFEFLETKQSKKENFEITKKALDKLDWNYETTSTELTLTYNKFILKFIQVIIIPQNEKIYFNFKYNSTTKTGRLPFYFGICTFLKWKFKQSIKTELNKKDKLF